MSDIKKIKPEEVARLKKTLLILIITTLSFSAIVLMLIYNGSYMKLDSFTVITALIGIVGDFYFLKMVFLIIKEIKDGEVLVIYGILEDKIQISSTRSINSDFIFIVNSTHYKVPKKSFYLHSLGCVVELRLSKRNNTVLSTNF